jgi:WD40 repeat protein/serine/threonine protein kinase
MTPDFQREEALFNAASELESAAARAAYLARECAGDDRLRERIEEMLESDTPAAEYFRAPQPEFHGHAPEPEPNPPGPNSAAAGYGSEAIGCYRLLEKLGEGGFGTVYVAEQTQPVRRRVALKVIKAGMDTREVIARFNTERQALALMDHPNIAKVLDAGSTNAGRPYFVMELVQGTRITEYCDQERLGIPQRLDLIISVCRAVQHAHQKGVIHRDLKPSNILVVVQDGAPVPKVIDFGIAKATEGGLTHGTVHTQFHQLVGTPAYMSPEQAELTGLNVDTRSDIYSLGVLLYELLTGFTPFRDEDLLASGWDGMRRMIREKDPAPPSTRLSQSLRTAESKTGNPISNSAASPRGLPVKEQIALLKGDLDWIVMKCLEKDRNRRYETANGLAMDIQRHLRNEPVSAGPPGKIYIFKKFIARHRWAVVANAIIALLILAGLIGTSLGLRRATAARILADQNAARANQLADAARRAETAARAGQTNALRQAYSASMLSASDALERGQIDAARRYLDSAPMALRGWEWRHLSSRLDLSIRVHNYPRVNTHLHALPDGLSYYDVSAQPIGGIRRRDMDTGQLLATLPTRRAYYLSWLVAGGKQLIALTCDDGPGAVEVWDVERGALLASHPSPNLVQAAPDGSRVAYLDGQKLHIMETRSGVTRASGAVPFHDVMCFQPDGRRLAVSTGFGKVALVDTESLQVLNTFEAHRNNVVGFGFSPDGRWLATGSMDNTIRVTDVSVNPPAAVATLRGQNGWIDHLRFSPDGSLLVSASQDRTVRLWETKTGESRAALQIEGTDPSFLPDGRTLIVGDAEGVRFWDISSLDAWVLRGHRGYVYPVMISPDGATIYSGGWDGYVGQPGSLRFWDAATGDEIAATEPADAYVRAAVLSADGSRLAISVTPQNGVSSRIDILDTATGTTVASVDGLGVLIDSLAFDPAAKSLIWIDTFHGVAHLADARTGIAQKPKKLFAGGRGANFLPWVAWSPDGATIALCDGGGGTVELLNAQSLEPVQRWPLGHRAPVRSLAFSPDSRRLLTTSEDGIARVWDAATGARLHDLVGHASRVLCAAYSPDGKRIASGGDDHNARIWDAETFDQVARLGGHEDYVYSLAWRADSQQLVSGSGDNTLRIWDTQPLKGRVQARRERQTILGQVEPMVQRLFAELGEARKVVERVKADPSLGARARQIALQVALRTSLARRQSGQP